MIIDPVATAGLVAREVRTGSRDGVPTKIAVATRTYPTDQADLWDAVTNPDRIPRWFLPVSRSEEHTSELQSLMRISYAVFCLNKKKLYTQRNPKKTETPHL